MNIPIPTVRVSARRISSVSVASISRPSISSVTVHGPQGPAGPQGQQGIQGVPGDYGYVRYDEITATPINLVPGVQQPFTLTAPLMVANSLRSPFANASLLDNDGKTVRVRASGDSYLVRVRYSVVAQIANGSLQTNLFVTGNTTGIQGASATRIRTLSAQAGTSERVDELFQIFPGAGFVLNGALFQLQSSVPCVVSTESLIITPVVAAS